MKVMAQIAMVMNLDKCIGCHTCSVTCKQAWTNREGAEYMWFNNVETRPGVGYPRRWEDQDDWHGGWRRTASGRVVPRLGGHLSTLAKIFANPYLPGMDDYYEPWTYEYDKLLSAPAGQRAIPTARARSQITGRTMDTIEWGPNWDDDLGGSMETLDTDPVLRRMNLTVSKTIEDSFMFHLPRICEHCLNPTCVSVCPSGAMYKRAEDGIVLVDQDRCRGWRMCVSGCPYKKVYFNHETHKAEKCTLCYPRLEVGQPTVCSETCVGRLRYLGVLLYDADRVSQAAAVADPQDLYMAQRSILLDPRDPEVIA
ncbi:MAG: nitrate reductase subunit beta, partial [Propionibacterium acidifaciens]